MKSIYLDHQATTPLRPEVLEAMQPYLTDRFGNASSLHRFGLEGRDALERARQQAAAFVRADSPEEIIFTSGGTEATNLAIKGAAWAGTRRGNHLVVSATEHPAVLRSVEFLETHGFRSTKVKVDSPGRIDPQMIVDAVTDETCLVAIHHANHETGAIQPVEEIAKITADRGIPLFVDATMSAGWLPVDLSKWGAAIVALAPHRFYGPKGVGILYKNRRMRLTPLLHGGDQEDHHRAGTENLPAIVGAGVACDIAARELVQRTIQTRQLQEQLWKGLHGRVPYVRLNGPPPGLERLPTLLNVSFEFVEGEGIVLMLDVQGVAVASGSACISRSLKASPVLSAMGLDETLARGSVLFSPGAGDTPEEMDLTIDAVVNVVERLRAMSPAWDDFQRGATDSLIAPRRSR